MPIKRLLLACAVVALALPATAASKRQPMRLWDNMHPLAKGAAIGPFKVVSLQRIQAKNSDGDKAVKVSFADATGATFSLTSEVAFDDVYAGLGAARIDLASDGPQLMMLSFTGGAHCCTHIQIADHVGGRWTVVDVGTFDGGDLPGDFPVDEDGDGVTDVLHYDDRFAYAFCAYACSWMPPRVFNVTAGKVQDVSAAPRYRKLFEGDFAEARKACQEDGNAGACAGVVADGARLGRFKEAMAFALAHVRTEPDWSFPGCKAPIGPKGECPRDKMYMGADFRVALTKYLAQIGYIPG